MYFYYINGASCTACDRYFDYKCFINGVYIQIICKKNPLMCYYCRNHISVLLFPNLTSPYKTYRRISTCISNTVCVTCGSIIDYASGAPKCIPVSCGIVVDQFSGLYYLKDFFFLISFSFFFSCLS